MQSGEWCDTVNGERGVAVIGQMLRQPPSAGENLRITAGRYKKSSEGERAALPIF